MLLRIVDALPIYRPVLIRRPVLVLAAILDEFFPRFAVGVLAKHSREDRRTVDNQIHDTKRATSALATKK